jgi:hypothetical protein
MKKTASILILTMLAGCAGTGAQFAAISGSANQNG